MDTFVTLCGNVVADPARKATPSGVAVAGLRIASTPRRFDRAAGEWKDGTTLFINVTCWRGLADNVAKSLHKGDPVIVYGRLVLREWTDKEGQPRHAYEVDAAVVGPDLSRAECGQIRRPAWAAPSPSWVTSLDDAPPADEMPPSDDSVPADGTEPADGADRGAGEQADSDGPGEGSKPAEEAGTQASGLRRFRGRQSPQGELQEV